MNTPQATSDRGRLKGVTFHLLELEIKEKCRGFFATFANLSASLGGSNMLPTINISATTGAMQMKGRHALLGRRQDMEGHYTETGFCSVSQSFIQAYGSSPEGTIDEIRKVYG